MRRGVLNTADLVRDATAGMRYQAVMVTTTYRDPDAWAARHMSELTDLITKWSKRRRCRIYFVWVAELTQAGRVHYHLIVWLPESERLPMPDAAGWWKHGMTRTEKAHNGPGYLASYVSKGEGVHTFPRGLRLHGRGGLTDTMRLVVRWWLLPRYVREQFEMGSSNVRRAIGGGWVDAIGGEWVPPWKPPDDSS
jgi:hypothetical protein